MRPVRFVFVAALVVVCAISFIWLQSLLPDGRAHVQSLVEFRMKTRESGDCAAESFKTMTSLVGFEVDPASFAIACEKQESDLVFDTRATLPNELRDLSHVVDRVDLAKRAWDTSYNELRKATMTWIQRRRVPCSFSDDSCQAVELDAEVECHLHHVRAQALAIATNIVLKTVSGPYPATPEGANERKRCSKLSLLMLTQSIPWNFQGRKNARETWLALAQSNLDGKKLHFHGNKPFHWTLGQKEDFVWSHRFVLDLALDRADSARKSILEVVFKEQSYYRDILLYPGVENAAKTSWKVFWELAHVERHQTFEYLLLLEDDSFVRFDLVVQYLSANHHEKLYSGCLYSKSRHSSKQGGSQKLPSNSASVLSFVNGAGTFLSRRAVLRLLYEIRNLPKEDWNPTDDVFIGQVCQKGGIHPQNLPSVHVRRGDRDRVKLFNCRSSNEDIEFTMISKNLPRKMFNRMTSGVGSLKLCPGIRLERKRISKRNIPKGNDRARDRKLSSGVHTKQTKTVTGSVTGAHKSMKDSGNWRTKQTIRLRPKPLTDTIVIYLVWYLVAILLVVWCAVKVSRM